MIRTEQADPTTGGGWGGHVANPAALPLAVYTAEPALQAPRQLLRSMWRDLMASRELAWRLFVRDVSAQYRQSLLGITWAILPPILTGLVFIFLQSRSIINLGHTDVPYPVFVLVGTIYWQIFIDAVNAPLKSVTSARPIITRINFPREALILSAAYTVLFNLFLKGIVLIGVLLYFGVSATPGLLLAPAAIALLILLGLGIGLALTPVGMLYTDIGSGLMVFTQIWFFATPVVYPPPEEFPLSLFATLNPVSPMLTAARDLTTKGTLSDPTAFLAVGGLAIALLLGAWVLFRIALPVITERMSA